MTDRSRSDRPNRDREQQQSSDRSRNRQSADDRGATRDRQLATDRDGDALDGPMNDARPVEDRDDLEMDDRLGRHDRDTD